MILGERTGNGPHIDYIPDALGSVVAAVDQNLVTTYTAAYSPFGSVIASAGTAPNFTWVGTLGYLQSAGRPFAEYSVRARLFSSRNGRWTSTDAFWPVESPFNYARQSPVGGVDPSGHLVWPSGCCSDEIPPMEQTFKNWALGAVGSTNIYSVISWFVRTAERWEGWGPVQARWQEKMNDVPDFENLLPNRWNDISDKMDPAFKTLYQDQDRRVEHGCPKNGASGQSSDDDLPRYSYEANSPRVRCLCFLITVTSACTGFESVYRSSQTVSFDNAPHNFYPTVKFPSDPLTDMYCSGQVGECSQAPRGA